MKKSNLAGGVRPFLFLVGFSLLAVIGFVIWSSQPKKTTPANLASPIVKKSNSQGEISSDQFTVGKYPIHQDIPATIFWVGEPASQDNNYISNEKSAWDSSWLKSYGGVDDPSNRNGFYPANFIPEENPFYVALPYSDFDENRKRKPNVVKIPWYKEDSAANQSIIKNRWLKIGLGEKICFAQWEDVGPGEDDDFDYVFGNSRPKNPFSGIDLSSALRDCLGIGGRGEVTWQFIDEEEVPPGPWKEIITKSGTNWHK